MFHRLLRSTLPLALVLGSLAGAATAADYRVWYYDSHENHQPGDISIGSGAALVKPNWACGLRIKDPSYYRWVREFPFAQTPSADLYQDLHIWLPGAGCPYNNVTIQYRDGSQTFAYPGSRDYMEITGYYGKSWINAQGKVPSCNCLPDFPYKISSNGWHVVPNGFADLKSTLGDTQHQSQSAAIVSDLQAQLAALSRELNDRIALRQRTDLLDRERSVRDLESKAATDLATASRALASCSETVARRDYDAAYAMCDAALNAFNGTSALIDLAQDSLQPQAGE